MVHGMDGRGLGRGLGLATAALIAVGPAACTTFGAPQSAEVRPGWSASYQMTMTTPVDDENGWFWSFDCASQCGHVIIAPEVALTWSVIEPGSPPAAVGIGLNGTYPFVDVYVQAGGDERPFGFGGRAGSTGSWHELRLYGRYDVSTSESGRLLWNPALFLLTGNSPNGANPGSFAAVVQSVGFEARGERFSAVPGASIVLGRGVRTSFGERVGPFTALFATFSIRLTFQRRPRDPEETG